MDKVKFSAAHLGAHRLQRNSYIPLRLIFTFCLFLPTVVFAEELLEYQVKAAYILNFTKFIDWQPEAFSQPDSPIEICILGGNPFRKALDQTVAGETVHGRKVTVRQINEVPASKSCQALFIGKTEKDVVKILTSLPPGILTIGETQTFIKDGGVIAFVIENRHVRFLIRQAVAESAGLKISSRLLNVAKAVEK